METDGGGRCGRGGGGTPIAGFGRHPAFVGQHLGRLRQVERRIGRVRRNVDEHVALFDDLVRQAEALVAKDQGGFWRAFGIDVACGLAGDMSCEMAGKSARRPHRRRKFAQPGRHRGGEIAPFQRLADVGDDARAAKHILGAAGKSDCLGVAQGVGKAWIDQYQIGKPHGLDGPRDGADIAGTASFD